jgi:hypothetical protein
LGFLLAIGKVFHKEGSVLVFITNVVLVLLIVGPGDLKFESLESVLGNYLGIDGIYVEGFTDPHLLLYLIQFLIMMQPYVDLLQ